MTRTFRAGPAKLFLFIGPALVVLGLVLFGLLPLVGAAALQQWSLLWMLLGLPVFAGVGLLLAVLGHRSRMVLGPEAVSWRGMSGPERSVPYAAIRAIEPPDLSRRGRGPATARLHLMDGSTVALVALRRSPDEGTIHDPSLTAAMQALDGAHAAWWAAARR